MECNDNRLDTENRIFVMHLKKRQQKILKILKRDISVFYNHKQNILKRPNKHEMGVSKIGERKGGQKKTF